MSDLKERYVNWEQGKVHKALSRFPERQETFTSTSDIECKRLDGFTKVYQIDDFREWYFGIELRYGISKDIEMSHRTYTYYGIFSIEKISTGQYIELQRYYLPFSGALDLDCNFNHKVQVDLGASTPFSGMWNAYYYLWDMGCRQDISGQDCKVDMKDVGLMTKYYGAEFTDEDDWFLYTQKWKCDINIDFKIDVKDVAYIASKYGESW